MFSKKTGIGIVLALVLILTACGSKAATEPEAITTEPVQHTASPETAQEETKQENTEGQTRVVQDEFGDVVIPVAPKRVAAIYLEDYLTVLNVEPIVQWYHPWWGKQDYLNLDVPLFDMTGSIEALLDAEPDIIIVDGSVDAAKYEMYSKVAPTYRLKEEILLDPEAILRTIADLLGVQDQAVAAMEQYRQVMNETKQQLQAAVGDETVAVLRLEVGEKSLIMFSEDNRYIGNIYDQMGLTPAPLATRMEGFNELLSEEVLPELEADHIILFTSDGNWDSENNKEAIAWLEGSLWKNVPALKKGQVYIVDRSHWQSGAMKANLMKADDLLKNLVK
ncbi:ABC transporter substrate-binding protein [Paenibacillus sp. MER 99-2]|uniref:ABC transporter substrate-binding protein n=1 Tax=Paenibacillus sp. MER 99-2 TaxID=2939572 RepID=UPI00203F737D|nr:ABC transporter substrate-binding protein [Paenibacillus sp. MER 99-2]MCM3171290.1 ABC transporter substrate-binding protein [Paenibacillus sp. MER 99-2]